VKFNDDALYFLAVVVVDQLHNLHLYVFWYFLFIPPQGSEALYHTILHSYWLFVVTQKDNVQKMFSDNLDLSFMDVFALFGCDLLAGGLSGAAVTPVISAVDRALAENASGRAKLWPSFFGSLREYASRPLTYVRGPQFFYIWIIYGGTYVAANTVETICSLRNEDPSGPKWVATSTVNTSTCIMKDRAFAQLFGTAVASNVPMGAYAAWLSRDFLSMGVFFTAPPIVGEMMKGYTGSAQSGYYAAQIGLPLILQFVTAPLHLLGYDIYNNPKNTIKQRFQFMGKDYLKNVSIRMVRMAPPWSFGTIGNKEIRENLHDYLKVYPKRMQSTLVYHVSG